MSSLLLFLCLHVDPFSSIDQGVDNMNLEIIKSEFIISQDDPLLKFDVRIKGDTTCNYLLYAFNSVLEESVLEEKDYCGGDVTAGNVVFITDTNYNRVYARISMMGYKPVTLDTMEVVFQKERQRFREGKILLEQGVNQTYSWSFDLEKFELEKGEYLLFVMYYQGNNLTNIVPLGMIQEDQEKYNALVFQGCIKSNTVKLIVK